MTFVLLDLPVPYTLLYSACDVLLSHIYPLDKVQITMRRLPNQRCPKAQAPKVCIFWFRGCSIKGSTDY